MSFKITCPECSAQFPILAGLIDDDGKRLAAMTGEMEPALARAALTYLRFFKPQKTALRTSRAIVILQELVDLVRIGSVCKDERGGIRRPATFKTWVAGIEAMHRLDGRLSIPLANHNYLRSIVFGLADSEDANAEANRDKSIRASHAQGAPAIDEQAIYLKQQFDRGQISQDEYDKRIGERRRVLQAAATGLKSIMTEPVK